MRLELSKAEYAELTCDIEGAIEELTELSREIDWFASETPERLLRWLEFFEAAKESQE